MFATFATVARISGGNSTPAVAATGDFFSVTLACLGTLLPCFAFAWDGLVRRQLLLPAFPVGAALGAQALRLRRLGGLAIGLGCLLTGVFFLLVAWGLWHAAAQRQCEGQGALTCLGTLVGSVKWPAWAWLGLCMLWFVVVWLRLGDPRKHVLVYGVWYHQERVARAMNRYLQEQGLAPLPQERLYGLEEAVLSVMRTRGWLVYGEAWLDGGQKRTAVAVAPETMVQEALLDPKLTGAGSRRSKGGMNKSERVAIEWLLAYFRGQAQRAEHLSPLRRWWVGTGQKGRLGVYGRRAL